jgi:hypothetical protein
MSDEIDRVAQALAAPFDPDEVKFKAQTVSGNRALAVPFVDARVIQDRLDDVLGVMGWQDKYEPLPDGSVVCALSIRLGTEWVTKMDVGGESEQPDGGDRRKAAFSDALKRAAVKFGIGRYLYRQKPQWVDYDPQKRQFTRQPVLPGHPAPPPAKAAQPARPAQPAPDRLAKLQGYDADLHRWFGSVGHKLGDLTTHVSAALRPAHGEPAGWSEEAWAAARQATVAYEKGMRDRMYREVERLVEAKGYGAADMWALAEKVGAPQKTLSELSNEQLSRAADLLRPLPDVQKKRA